MAPPLQWDEVMILTAIVAFFERESRWPELLDFRTQQGLPSPRVVYKRWTTPANARWWAFHSMVAWEDDFPLEWQIHTSPY